MELIRHYFPNFTAEQYDQLAALQDLYAHWNAQINVISRKDMEHFYVHHVLHSLAIAKIVEFPAKADVLDIGTGGGFPGIPLAIALPQLRFTLVDSIGKKIKVVEEVRKSLNLQNVSAHHMRAEEVEGQFDYIVSRAVTQIDKFLPWTKGKIKPGPIKAPLKRGILYLKGGFIVDEFEQVPQYRVFDLSEHFKEEFFQTKKLIHIPRKR